MVQVIRTSERRTAAELLHGNPLVHIHHVERNVFGNGIAIHIYGEMRIAAKERIYARELKLNTLQTLTLTAETNTENFYHAQKSIYHKGEYDNYGSIDIMDENGTQITAGNGPDYGSVWLDFEALGE